MAEPAQLHPQQVAADPVARLPAVLLHRVRRGALGDPARPRLRLPRRLHRVPVRLRDAPVGGVRGSLHRVRDRARLRERLRPPADARRSPPQRDRARLCDRRARPLDRDRVPPDGGRVRRADEGRRRRGRPPRPLPARADGERRGHALGGGRRDAAAHDAGGPDHADAGLPDPLLRAGLRAAVAARRAGSTASRSSTR